jgi:hypothetical protein
MSLLARRPAFLLALACAAGPVAADAAPHVRTGLCAGVGFGYESLSWTDEDGGRSVEGSGVGNARVGYALQTDLVLGVEFWAWSKDYEISTLTAPVPVDAKLTATTLCVTYFPGSAGFFVRLGAGLAYGRVKVEPPPSVTTVASASDSETGFALDLAPGYEWRLSRRFAFGAQGDVVYLRLGDTFENAFGYGLSAQFNWYW